MSVVYPLTSPWLVQKPFLRLFEISKMDLLSEIDILEEDGCPLKEKLFGQFALLMNSTYEVIYKLLE